MEELVPINAIVVGERQRSLDPKAVAVLRDSIATIGLKTPISVRYTNDEEGYMLISGAHRLQACIDLGWTEIMVREETGSELDARLWEIAENLHRADLTVLERSEHIAEWIRLTAKRDEVSAQLEPKPLPQKGVGQGVGGGKPSIGIEPTARELGIERNEAQRAVKVDNLAPEAKAAARDLGLDDNQSALLAARKAETPAEQVAVLQEIKARKAQPKPPPTPIASEEDLTAIDLTIPSPAVEAIKRDIRALSTDDLRTLDAWYEDYIQKRDLD